MAHHALCVAHVSGIAHVCNHIAHRSSYVVHVLLVLTIIVLTAHNVCFMFCYNIVHCPGAIAHHLHMAQSGYMYLTAPNYVSPRFAIILFATHGSLICGVLLTGEQRLLLIFKGHSHVSYWFFSCYCDTNLFHTIMTLNFK